MIYRLTIATVLCAAPVAAGAVTLPPFLTADQGTDAVLISRDTDGDGTANGVGETGIFFDASSASGLPAGDGVASNVFTLTQGRDGAVYAGDGGSDTVYRLRDLDGDGTANGAGEAAVWFSTANAGGLTLQTPNGIAEGPDGAIYVTEADTGGQPTGDFIYRTIDLDGDGSANGDGEATPWLDLTALNPRSSAFEIAFDGDTAYIADTVGSDTNVVYAARDLDGSGTVTPDEVTRFIDGDNPFGVSVDFAMDAQDGSVFLWEFLDVTGPQSLWSLTDLDGSGSIDAMAEVAEIWTTDQLGDAYAAFAGFGMSVSDAGVFLTSNGGGANQDFVAFLQDLDGDGTFFGDGETSVALSRLDTGLFPDRPRAAIAYAGPSAAAIPLPAALPLLAGGLVALGLARGRLSTARRG